MGQTAIGRPRLTPRFKDTSPTVFDTFGQSVVRRGKRGINSLMDILYGSTPEEEAQTAVTSFMNPLATMTMGSALRNPAYRTQMLRKLGEQIQRLEEGPARNMLMRLLKSHPRVMSAFQHSEGVVRQDPRFMPEWMGTFRPGASSDRVPGLRDVRRGPLLNITPESAQEGIDFSRRRNLYTQYPISEVPQADAAAHEMTHWAQALGGRDLKRKQAILDEFSDLHKGRSSTSDYMNRMPRQRMDELKGIQRRMEEGAERAGFNQPQRWRLEEIIEGGQDPWANIRGISADPDSTATILNEARGAVGRDFSGPSDASFLDRLMRKIF
jgi:hypothetical protein